MKNPEEIELPKLHKDDVMCELLSHFCNDELDRQVEGAIKFWLINRSTGIQDDAERDEMNRKMGNAFRLFKMVFDYIDEGSSLGTEELPSSGEDWRKDFLTYYKNA